MSWACGLQKTLKLLGVAALNEEAVRVESVWQEDLESREALSAKTVCHPLRRRLTTSVGIGIEGTVNIPGAVA